MIIKKLDVGGFGKLVNKSLSLNPGMNIIYGENENGKTTLMTFVKMMFYSSSGKSEKSSDLFKALRKKYRPWSGENMAGGIEFEAQGLDFRLEKEFLKSEASDKTSIFCKTNGEPVKIVKPNEAGEHFFGMNLEEFDRSIFIGSTGGFSADEAGDSLSMRISNLTVSGDESISQDVIKKRLLSAMEELVSKSQKKGFLVEEENIIDNLEFEKQSTINLEESQKSLEIEISKLENEIFDLEENLKSISDKQRLSSAKKELNAYYALSNKQSLVKTVEDRFNQYNKTEEELLMYLAKAEEINQRIEESLSKIQEVSLFKDSNMISDEEYSKLLTLSEKADALRKDLEIINSRITGLETELNQKNKKLRLLSHIKTASVFILSIVLFFCVYTFAKSYLLPAAICSGALIFASLILFLTTKQRVGKRLDIQLVQRDIGNTLQSLSNFSDGFKGDIPSFKAHLNAKLSDTVTELSEKLSTYNCADLLELRKKSALAQSEDIEKITNLLNLQKNEFLLLTQSVHGASTYSAAKIFFVELKECLSSRKALSSEIETLISATGIEFLSEDAVKDKIRELGEFIKNAASSETESDKSEDVLRMEIKEKRHNLSEKQNRVQRPMRSLSDIEKDIFEHTTKLNFYKERYLALSIANDVMQEAFLETNKGLGSVLSKKVGENLSALSGEKYKDVIVPRNLSLEIKPKDEAIYHEWKYLSSGAIDHLYFALRLAISEIIAKDKEPLPLFLDDIFVQYDEENCQRAVKFLKSYLQDNGTASQIILFTCHKHIRELVRNIFDDVNEISL